MTESEPTAGAIPGAPRPLTPFIGRTNECAEVGGLLRQHRLVTLTGSGGGGKTRVALAAAQGARGRRHWVTLSSVDRAELVAPTVARSLGLSDGGTDTSIEEIASALIDDEVLLVLDNCEHVAVAAAMMVESLLIRCPDLTILATSRAPLRVAGEMLWPVPPMTTPGLDPDVTADRSDAVELFIERAQAVRPNFEADEAILTQIAAICRRLDGNPLAIELCAARSQVLSVGQIYAALDDSLRLLVTKSRSVPQRQQTLRATLDWSHRLLSTDEAQLFRRLAVFAGGATLDSVLAVGGSGLTAASTLDLMTGLADRSMVRVLHATGTARYQLPDAVRQYAQQKLTESQEDADCRRRHLRWFVMQARAADEQPAGPAQSSAFAELEIELPNVRAAAAWAREIGDRRSELELAVGLASFAIAHGHHREGREWLDLALASGGGADDAPVELPLVAKAFTAAGVLAFLQCDYAAATARLEASRAIFDELGDRRGAAGAVQTLGSIAREQGDYGRAKELLRGSVEFWRSVDDLDATGGALSRLGFTLMMEGDQAGARTAAAESIAIARRLSDSGAIAAGLIILGGTALHTRDLGLASACFDEARTLGLKDQLAEATAYAEEGLGLVALTRGDVAVARKLLTASLQRQHELGDHWRTSSVLVEIAACERLRGQPRAAARLLGAAEGLLEQIGGVLPPVEEPERVQTAAFVSGALTKDERDAVWMLGRSSPLATTVAAAISDASLETSGPLREGLAPIVIAAPRAAITLRALGREDVLLDGRLLTRADFSYAKPRELLFFLAENESANKEQIGLALWPEASATELRSAFHTTLHHLRRAVGASRVLFEHGRYRLDGDGLHYDVAEFSRGLAAARAASSRAEELRHLQQATQRYGGDFLPSSAPTWALRTRDELRHRYQRALLALGRMLLTSGGPAAAVEAYRRVIASDPLTETAHRELMRCYHALGEPSRAIRQYEELASLLRDELGITPANSTTELFDQIRAQLTA